MAGNNSRIDTAAYEMHVEISLTEVNTYGDHLSDKGELTFTKHFKAQGLSGLGQFLADLERLGAPRPNAAP